MLPTLVRVKMPRLGHFEGEQFTFAAGKKAVNFCRSEAAVCLLRLSLRVVRRLPIPANGWSGRFASRLSYHGGKSVPVSTNFFAAWGPPNSDLEVEGLATVVALTEGVLNSLGRKFVHVLVRLNEKFCRLRMP